MLALEEERYWQAVQDRDGSFDGSFVFGVRSTGIYCRPSCPARRPGREQVTFFVLPEAAEADGFRACLRCRPSEATRSELHMELVERVCRLIEESLDEGPVTLTGLSEQVHLSPYHLQRTFKRIMGITPRQYAEAIRLDRLKAQLKEGESVTGAMYAVGYGSSSRLYERAPGQLGMTPSDYVRGGQQVRISYTLAECPLGKLLVAATEKGICAVLLGDSEEQLEEMLCSEYPDADTERDHSALGSWVADIIAHLEGEQSHLDMPLDVRATAFQWKVWQALREIPYGSTRSYSEIAQAIGHPSAARAVARACATNRAALVIPCHRVVREDGDLGGYRWGVERKRSLLARERGGKRETGSGNNR